LNNLHADFANFESLFSEKPLMIGHFRIVLKLDISKMRSVLYFPNIKAF